MGLDAKEGLAHDNKRRDVKYEVQRQIVEIQAVIKHEPPDEGMERESQSVEEMGEEYYTLMGPGGGDERPLIWETVRDVVGQESGSPQFLDVYLRDGGDHPLASRSGHDWRRSR